MKPAYLRPFWRFYGGKWRLAPKYPAPKYDTIIEPFAGAAGYSTRYFDRNVILIEKDPVIAELWQWLIAASPDAVMKIPVDIDYVNDLGDVHRAVRSLVGFWFNDASARPANVRSTFAKIRGGWSEKIRDRIAEQVQWIKHWEIYSNDRCTPYFLQNIGTWFVDPPYQNGGSHYKCGVKDIDYKDLGDWCQCLRGQVIVCESEGATWLPFKPFCENQGQMSQRSEGKKKKTQSEVIWYNEQ